MLAFIAGVSGAAPPVRVEHAPPAPSGFALAAEVLGDESLPTFEVVLSEDAVDSLRTDPYSWTEGGVVYRDVLLSPVAVRLTGAAEGIDGKPSLRIDLDRYEDLELLGLRELHLDGLATDDTMMAQRVAYRLFRDHGLPASRATHARVSIAGEERGVYTVIEAVDPHMLALWGMWDGSLWDLEDGEFTPAYLDRFDPMTEDADPAPIVAIGSALAAGGDAVAATAVQIDWGELVDWFAATVVVGQLDGYPWHSPGDDTWLWFDAAGGGMTALPHSLDETFRRDEHDPFSGPGLLLQACLASPACEADYVASVWEVQATAERADLAGYALDVQEHIRPLVEADRLRPFTAAEVADAQDGLVDFVVERPVHLAAALGGQ